MMIYTQALRQCIEAMKLVDFKDCAESEELWHKLNAAQQVAEEVLKAAPLTDAEIEATMFPPRAQLKAEDWNPATKRPHVAPVAAPVLRDGEKQEPVGYDIFYDGEPCGHNFRQLARAQRQKAHMDLNYPGHERVIQPLYTHPAPAQPVVAVPEGWKLVPLEPTQEMLDSVTKKYTIPKQFYTSRTSEYKAMLAAAPQSASVSAAPSGEVERAAKAVLAAALDEACERVHPCDSNNDYAKAKTMSVEMQALFAAITATKE